MSLILKNDIALLEVLKLGPPLIHPDVHVAGNGSHAPLCAMGRYKGVNSRT